MGVAITIPANFNPRPHQERLMRFFDRGGKRAVIVWARRTGKDRTLLNQACKNAFRRRGLYWHLLPTLKQARKAVWDNITGEGMPLIESVFPRETIAARNESEMKLELTNGSIVQLVGADNYDSLIGANPVWVSFSEFAVTDPRSWDFVRPILAQNDGIAAFASTPRGRNKFFELFEYAKRTPAWYCETMPAIESGMVTAEAIQAERDSGMSEEMVAQEFYCSFNSPNEGSVYGRELERAERDGRIDEFEIDDAPLIVSMDIGFRDAAAAWYWQARPDGFLLVDYEEAIHTTAVDWVERINATALRHGCHVGKVWLPHDARSRTFATQRSALELMAAKLPCAIAPQLSVADGIEASRWVIERAAFNMPHCGVGVELMRNYRFEYDESRRVFSKEPAHDYASHCADAFRMGALVMKQRAVPQPKAKSNIRSVHEFTFDDFLPEVRHRERRV